MLMNRWLRRFIIANIGTFIVHFWADKEQNWAACPLPLLNSRHHQALSEWETLTRHCRCANMLILVCTHRKPAIVWRIHHNMKWKLSTIATKKRAHAAVACVIVLVNCLPPKHWGKTNMWVIEMKDRRDFPHPQGRKTRSGPMSSLPTASTLSSLFIYHCPCLYFVFCSGFISRRQFA